MSAIHVHKIVQLRYMRHNGRHRNVNIWWGLSKAVSEEMRFNILSIHCLCHLHRLCNIWKRETMSLYAMWAHMICSPSQLAWSSLRDTGLTWGKCCAILWWRRELRYVEGCGRVQRTLGMWSWELTSTIRIV